MIVTSNTRLPIAILFLIFGISFACTAQQTIVQYLSGTDKDHTVNWDFMVNNGRNSGQWSKIPVPSCWETKGFGTYSYYQDIPNANETGFYKYNFNLKPAYRGKKINLVFEGSMTDTEVKINGNPAGPTHRGGFYEFKYDITSLVKLDGPNLLEVTVTKKSAVNSINRAERMADFWLFGGIFRPVYVEILPSSAIERVAIDAKANGDFSMQVFHNATGKQVIEAQVLDLKGNPVEKRFVVSPKDSVARQHFTNIRLWNCEQPNLYQVVVSIKEGQQTIHTITQRFGFRTAELRENDGMYVNGKKVIFKGVCRHSEWPETGRTLSRKVHLMDIAAIKGMNMNAVRMSHYPPDKAFLDLCDSLGLFVLDELTGWQKAYDTVTAKRLVKELIVRDVNHPSIVLWDNGNEGGWNRAVDNDYALYDPQKRHVIHPWERFNGTNTKHYPDYKYVQNEVANAKEVFFPTEFMHGLFDGGHGAGLEDFWNLMLQHPHFAGGFLWSLHDEGVVRNDRHDSIDVAGNAAPDGIVGPHREREASYYTIRELWSPVYIETQTLAGNFRGQIEVENRYLYSNLDQVQFEWKVVHFPAASGTSTAPTVLQKGRLKAPATAPGEKATIAIPLQEDKDADAFLLTAFDPRGDTICSWSWRMQATRANAVMGEKPELNAQEDGKTLSITTGGIRYLFNKATGCLAGVFNGNKQVSLTGPFLAGSRPTLRQFQYVKQGDDYLVTASYEGDSLKAQWSFEKGRLPKLEYSYLLRDTSYFAGVTFDYPEGKITGARYLGRGPYRSWKNRLKGQQIGVWQKKYNNTITGESWDYPEFKGYFPELSWVQLQNTERNFVVYADAPGTYLQLLQPQKPKGATNNNTSPPFPDGSIGFLTGIPAIGTKFNRPEVMGPQSQRNIRAGNEAVKGVLYFDFR